MLHVHKFIEVFNSASWPGIKVKFRKKTQYCCNIYLTMLAQVRIGRNPTVNGP